MKLKILVMLFFVINLFSLTLSEKQALSYMYEEEKLAKDIYFVLGKIYPNVRVFDIYNSEIKHESSVVNVMKHYNLPLPQRGDKIGSFKNLKLQKLYNQLISKGKKSLKDALEVGIMVEVTDIEDLDKFLQKTTSLDIKALFEFLRDGSYNHYFRFKQTLNSFGNDICKNKNRWCKTYPFKRGIGREYKNWYWFRRIR